MPADVITGAMPDRCGAGSNDRRVRPWPH